MITYDKEIEILNVEELALLLKCSPSFIHKLKRESKIPYIKLGNSLRFVKQDVLKAIESMQEDYF
ncbi:MAG: helix-turn-helix domain-containing protein [Clostridia bacterium]|nr:helix-turn-helix domain-containing protein [Clostridia bacterium]